ncbi:MAG: hypothetical protein IJ676_05845, partial [Clostridia bacterium]|nr:hypothetical protein [Clostridia bacterium]
MTIKDVEKLTNDIAHKYDFEKMPYNIDGGQSSVMCREISGSRYEIRVRTPEKYRYDDIEKDISDFVSLLGFTITEVVVD